MYLKMLNEMEKKLFIDLAYHLVSADDVYSDEERKLMNEYYLEMQMSPAYEKSEKPIDDIIKELQEDASEQIKKIIIFELIGLALVDERYDMAEKELITRLEREFDIDKQFLEKCEDILKQYIAFQKDINKLILG